MSAVPGLLERNVFGIIGQRQLVQRAEAELGIGDAPPRVGEHVR